MTDPHMRENSFEKKHVYYGRSMAIACLFSGTGLLLLTPLLLSMTKSLLHTMTEEFVAPILMTFAVAIFAASMILLLGAVITGLFLPTKITYETNNGNSTAPEKKAQ